MLGSLDDVVCPDDVRMVDIEQCIGFAPEQVLGDFVVDAAHLDGLDGDPLARYLVDS